MYRPTIKALLTKTRNQKNAICVDISLKMFLGMAKKWIVWSCLFKNKLIEILIVYPEEIWKLIRREYRCYKQSKVQRFSEHVYSFRLLLFLQALDCHFIKKANKTYMYIQILFIYIKLFYSISLWVVNYYCQINENNSISLMFSVQHVT